MNQKEKLFYNEYEQFYQMASTSNVFHKFCEEAYGEDFSQDGFSDIRQVNRIFQHIPKRDNIHILDIGCGNGKMLGYLQKRTGAYIYGFDYSQNAIETAQKSFPIKSEFIQGNIGEVNYPKEKFDLITSMDTMYFAPDISAFLIQIMSWLKKDGVLFVGYQEGDVMPKTDNAHTTVFSRALQKINIEYEVIDITQESYEMLHKKRQTAIRLEEQFSEEGNRLWYEMLMAQTDYIKAGYEDFVNNMARYIYIIKK